MIPRIEDYVIEELEKRICDALPDTAPNENQQQETFVVSIETRKFTPCVQAQENFVIFGEVEAELTVVFYSQKQRVDYTPLYICLAKNPYIKLADGVSARIGIDHCEAVEGPYLSNDAWLIRITYPIFDFESGLEWQQPHLGDADTNTLNFYPRAAWDKRNEPEGVI